MRCSTHNSFLNDVDEDSEDIRWNKSFLEGKLASTVKNLWYTTCGRKPIRLTHYFFVKIMIIIIVASYIELISVTQQRSRCFNIQYFLQGMWIYIWIMRPGVDFTKS